MTAPLLILLSSRGAARLALQLLMPLHAQPRKALIKGFVYEYFFLLLFSLRRGIASRWSFDDYLQMTGLLRNEKPNTKLQLWILKILDFKIIS